MDEWFSGDDVNNDDDDVNNTKSNGPIINLWNYFNSNCFSGYHNRKKISLIFIINIFNL